jgi:hypothetical protein
MSWKPSVVAIAVAAAMALCSPARAVSVGVVLLADAGDPAPAIAPIMNPTTTGAGGTLFGQQLGVSFVTLQDFAGVRIGAHLTLDPGDDEALGRAFLTTAFGPGTSPADVVAEVDFTLTASGFTTLFDGLSLSAGAYYLILAAAEAETGRYFWNAVHDGFAGLVTFQAGYAGGIARFDDDLDVAFPPASAFFGPSLGEPFLLFQVLAELPPDDVDEPPALALLALCLAALGSIRWAARGARPRAAMAPGGTTR